MHVGDGGGLALADEGDFKNCFRIWSGKCGELWKEMLLLVVRDVDGGGNEGCKYVTE